MTHLSLQLDITPFVAHCFKLHCPHSLLSTALPAVQHTMIAMKQLSFALTLCIVLRGLVDPSHKTQTVLTTAVQCLEASFRLLLRLPKHILCAHACHHIAMVFASRVHAFTSCVWHSNACAAFAAVCKWPYASVCLCRRRRHT